MFIISSSWNIWVIKVNRIALSSRMDKLRQEIGPVGIPTAELVEEGGGDRKYATNRTT